MAALLPTTDLVAVQWLIHLADLLPANTGFNATLPNPWDSDTGPSSWEGRDFITVQTVGGRHQGSKVRNPVAMVDCWSRATNQNARPPWARANQLAEIISEATETRPSVVLDLPGTYLTAKVGDVSVRRVPTRVPDDSPGIARYSLDLELVYIVVEGS